MTKQDNVHWFLEPLKKYAEFDGRARRKEFWWFVLFSWATVFMLTLLEAFTLQSLGVIHAGDQYKFGMLAALYVLATIIPFFAVAVRRLHDSGNSGWWLLIALLPFGGLGLFVFFIRDSTPDNRYGPNPKHPAYVVQADNPSSEDDNEAT